MIEILNEDNLVVMATMPNESIDVICIDPPYLYLKKQKLERVFDEPRFFSECKRLLTKNGFIVMFGRGTSFYRWNTILDGLGFTFKEEIIWNKSMCSSPLLAISRVHETVSLYCKGKGSINRCKVPYIEMKGYDLESVIQDIKRMKSVLKNPKSLNAVIDFIENNKRDTSDGWDANNLSISSTITKEDRAVSVMRGIKNGLNEKSIVRTDLNSDMVNKNKLRGTAKEGYREVNVFQSMEFGLNEKSVIKQTRDHYTSIHPTQKPVSLIERLLALVIPDKPRNEILVADFFAGSMSTMAAVFNMGMQGIATEIDEEYFLLGKKRIEDLQHQTKLF